MTKNQLTITGALLALTAFSTGAVASSLDIGNGSGTPGGTAITPLTYNAATPFVQDATVTLTYNDTVLTPNLTSCLDTVGNASTTATYAASTCDLGGTPGTIVITFAVDNPGAFPPQVLDTTAAIGSIEWTIAAGATVGTPEQITGTTSAGGSGYTTNDNTATLVEITDANFPVTAGEVAVTDTPPPACTLDITTTGPLNFTMSSQTLQATLDNTGDADCTSIAPTVTGAGYALDATTTTCTATLTPTDAPCDIGITFSGTLGDTGELSVASNDADTPDTLALTSTAQQQVCTLAITTPTFTMSPQTLQGVLDNTGTGDCTDIIPTVTGAGYALDAATTTCTATLTPTDAPCDIGITFSGTLGDAGELSVASSDPNTPTVGPLTSTAVAPVAIPTLSQWSMILVGSVLALLAMFGMRRKEG